MTFHATPASLSLSRKERLDHRNKMIEKMSQEDHNCYGVMYWTLIYDFQIAHLTTNLAQLKEIGYETFTTEEWDAASFTKDEQNTILKQLFDGLAKIGLYFINTNHMTNDVLFKRLVDEVLIEPVRDLVAPDVDEFVNLDPDIDCDPMGHLSGRDSTLPKSKRMSKQINWSR